MTIVEQILTALIPVFVGIGWGVAKLITAWTERVKARGVTEAETAKQKAIDDAATAKAKAAALTLDATADAEKTSAEAEAIRAKARVDLQHADEMKALREDVNACKQERLDDRAEFQAQRAADHAECDKKIAEVISKVATLTDRVNSVTPPSMPAVTP